MEDTCWDNRKLAMKRTWAKEGAIDANVESGSGINTPPGSEEVTRRPSWRVSDGLVHMLELWVARSTVYRLVGASSILGRRSKPSYERLNLLQSVLVARSNSQSDVVALVRGQTQLTQLTLRHINLGNRCLIEGLV
mmetsp:Transcript_33117/g.49022  ORF Transcript_33117/g.49022 Transcript_33117/m.49022 type:complete len:136 (-) Transcript_33117:178-585(-)